MKERESKEKDIVVEGTVIDNPLFGVHIITKLRIIF